MSVAAITYDPDVVRWEPNSRERLEQAALALYGEHGFENTTVAEIAQRAGLTERTFFRHFADKREVLFRGGSDLQEMIVTGVIEAPDGLSPIDAAAAALEVVGARVFSSERREFARQRQAVIAANPELQERELAKLASLSSAVADGLHQRGVQDPAARLTAELAMAMFRTAFAGWIADDQSDYARLVRDALVALKELAAA